MRVNYRFAGPPPPWLEKKEMVHNLAMKGERLVAPAKVERG